jgi:hypothetical protein
MSMLNTHGVMPASASASGAAGTITTSAQVNGTLSAALYGLGITLLILTAVFALAAISGLLTRRSHTL